MPELDTIRGLAILGVVVYHAFYWSRDFGLFTIWQRRFLALRMKALFPKILRQQPAASVEDRANSTELLSAEAQDSASPELSNL